MNHWERMLAQAPTLLQRLIARRHRISVPRGGTAPERVRRLRSVLCHAATVQVLYAGLDARTQAALQELRARPRGLSQAQLVAQYGPVRSLTAITTDPTPRSRSIGARLLLLGWLLPRPATRHHPTRYLLPPELRCWLPRPLTVSTHGRAPAPSLPPVVQASTALLIQPFVSRACSCPGWPSSPFPASWMDYRS